MNLPEWVIQELINGAKIYDDKASAMYKLWLFDHWDKLDPNDQKLIKSAINTPMYIRTIDKIIIHWSASTHGDAAHIRQWHRERPDPFDDIGYHFVISDRNTIETGRPITKAGAHCIGQNFCSIGICYIGSPGMPPIYKPEVFFENGVPLEKPQPRWLLLIDLVKSLLVTYNLKPNDVYGHRDFAKTECPGFYIENLRRVLRGEENE